MGDPRKTRKKYETPVHPWVASRIEEERTLQKSYGTKNKRELYKMGSALKRFKDQAKRLAARDDAQSNKEQEQLMERLSNLGLVSKGASLDDILSLSINDLMNRRLQTILVKRLLARSTKQARQLITHAHVLVGKKVITSPSYFVTTAEESDISFRASSPFINEQHPERFSEAELEAQHERARQKAALRTDESEEDAPPTFAPVDVEGTEKSAKELKAEPKVEAKVAEKPASQTPEKPTEEPTKEAEPQPEKTKEEKE